MHNTDTNLSHQRDACHAVIISFWNMRRQWMATKWNLESPNINQIFKCKIKMKFTLLATPMNLSGIFSAIFGMINSR